MNMYYIICLSDNEYLFDYNLSDKHIKTTPADIEARQFQSKSDASYVAEIIGGVVNTVHY